MKKVLKLLVVCLVLGSVLLSISFAAITKSPEFVLDKFKMKLGDTQSIAGIFNGDFDLEGFDTSDPSVVEITAKGYLKAHSTGASTISYTYVDPKGKTVTISTHVEVTRYDATFDTVGGGVSKEDIYLTLDTGDVKVKIHSTTGAIPTFPEVSKGNLVFDGWYMDAAYQTKVTERQRFNKDTTLYAKWITSEEASTKTVVPSELYDDINGHWAKVAIDAVTYKGLFQGVADRTFGPEITMTRAMAVAVLGRLENGTQEVSIQGFKLEVADVDNSSYYAPQLAWAIDNKIVTDLKDGKFRPNDEITREEIAVYIANYLDYKKYKVTDILSANFADIKELPKESYNAIDKLYNAGIMQGMDSNNFAPAASTTRAQMAQIFYNLYNFMMKYKG